jgi:hypothetical protein
MNARRKRNVMERIESAIGGMVEAPFRVFRSRLHPAVISHKLENAMDRNLMILHRQRIAPNVYDVFLSPRDYQQFQQFQQTLVKDWQDGLIETARNRSYKLTTRPVVLLHETASAPVGQVRVQAHLAEAQPGGGGLEELDEGLDVTRSLNPDERVQLAEQIAQAQAQAKAPPQAIPPAWLTLRQANGGGQSYRMERPIIHIGRHSDNDVVVNDKRVSRYHAQIRFERGQFVLYDLASLNGIGINGVLTHGPVALQDGDQVAVGNHNFVFQRG